MDLPNQLDPVCVLGVRGHVRGTHAFQKSEIHPHATLEQAMAKAVSNLMEDLGARHGRKFEHLVRGSRGVGVSI